MTKKRTSEKLKKLYKILSGVFGVSLITNIINILLINNYNLDSAAYEFAEIVFGGVGLFFSFLGGFGIVPLLIMVTLVAVSIAFAVKEKNHKNIFNFGLWATEILIAVSAVLQNFMITEMV